MDKTKVGRSLLPSTESVYILIVEHSIYQTGNWNKLNTEGQKGEWRGDEQQQNK